MEHPEIKFLPRMKYSIRKPISEIKKQVETGAVITIGGEDIFVAVGIDEFIKLLRRDLWMESKIGQKFRGSL